MRSSALVAMALAAAFASPPAAAKPAKQKPKKPRVTEQADFGKAPSTRYGAMTAKQCAAELVRREIPHAAVKEARGVLAPVRLTGPVGGVTWRIEAPAAERAKSPHEVFDCRLVLALSDFGEILQKHGVEEAHMFSAWRPPPKSWPSDKAATRHPGGLAVDLRRVVKKAGADGKRGDLVVERDWVPRRDSAPCSSKVEPETDAARQLRAIFCEADERRLFTVMLSPNYDKAHENHFHLEVTPGVKWRLVL